MDWYFPLNNILQDRHTGYSVILLKGTWARPADLLPKAPKDMSIVEQARYLRLGFEFIDKTIKEKSTSNASALQAYIA